MNINLNVVSVVYAANEKFAKILGVSLVSIYANNKDVDDIVVYVLDSEIKDENKDKLLMVLRQYSQTEVQFIPAKDISKNGLRTFRK